MRSMEMPKFSPEEGAAFGGGAGAVAGRFVFGAAFVFEVVSDADQGVADGVSGARWGVEYQEIFAIFSLELDGSNS